MWRLWNKLFNFQYVVVTSPDKTMVKRCRQGVDGRLYIEHCGAVYFLKDSGIIPREHYAYQWKWEPLTWVKNVRGS